MSDTSKPCGTNELRALEPKNVPPEVMRNWLNAQLTTAQRQTRVCNTVDAELRSLPASRKVFKKQGEIYFLSTADIVREDNQVRAQEAAATVTRIRTRMDQLPK